MIRQELSYHCIANQPLHCVAHRSRTEHFERRARQLKGHDDIIEGIVTHAAQNNVAAEAPNTV